MDHLGGIVSGPRPGRMRDRRARGARGPLSLPGPLTPRGVPVHRSGRDAFDGLVRDILAELDRAAVEPRTVDVVVEEAPLLPPEWSDEVPLSIISSLGRLPRVVIYRMPVLQQSRRGIDLRELMWTLILQRLGEIWHVRPEDLDPR